MSRRKEGGETMNTISMAHGEAFALMPYKCVKVRVSRGGELDVSDGCGHSEVIWNCRDGVTPFIKRCPKCGGEQQHVGRDEFAPFHVPAPGQRIWTDMTWERARAAADRKVAWIAKREGLPEGSSEIEGIRVALVENYYGEGHSPDCRIVRSASERFPKRRGVGYAGLRGLYIEFDMEAEEAEQTEMWKAAKP